MALTGFLRTPFLPVAGSTAADYELIEDQLDHLTVRVNGTTPDRLKLQPVFPGTLTFKPLPGERVPDDPSTTGPIRGNLFLEMSGTAQRSLRRADNQWSYGLVFVYLGITLDPTFFTNVVLMSARNASGSFRIIEGTATLTTAKQVSNAFARGAISIDINPSGSDSRAAKLIAAFPSLAWDPPAPGDSPPIPRPRPASFVLFARPSWDWYVEPPSFTGLTSERILAEANSVRIPIAYFYRMLSHLSQWSDLAVAEHADHAFISSVRNSELGDTPRWRQLRIFPVAPFASSTLPPTPGAAVAFEGAVATARLESPLPLPPPLWEAPINLLGQIFVRRTDGERFTLTVRKQDTSVVPLRRDLGAPDTDSVELTWLPPNPGSAPATIDIAAYVIPEDPLALPFQAIPYGAEDKNGLTVVDHEKRVVARGELVRPLQRLLRTLGFKIVEETGTFDLHTTWALREFQIYAAMDTVAVETLTAPRYADRLQAIPNAWKYTGAEDDIEGPEYRPGEHVTGIFDEPTAIALRAWRTNNLRCPVVIEKWSITTDEAQPELLGHRKELLAGNIWYPSEGSPGSHRVFVRDVSGYYDIPSERMIPPRYPSPLVPDRGRLLLGHYTTYNSYEGPICKPYKPSYRSTTWHEILPTSPYEPGAPRASSDTNITPLRLVGRDLEVPTPPADEAAVSTYKVISSVSEAECERVFDSLNGYDNAVMSMGVYHWIAFQLGAADKFNDQKNDVELPAYLAILKARAPEAYEKFFGRFGIIPSKTWEYPPRGNSLYNAQAKWIARFQQRGLRKCLRGVPTSEIDPSFSSIPSENYEDIKYLQTWHWFYRWVMANRLSQAVQLQQWYFARLRLREILHAHWGIEHPKLKFIKDVYSSERLATILLRAHVKSPGLVISIPDATLEATASQRLRDAFVDSGIDGNANEWTDAQMDILEAKLIYILTSNGTNTTLSTTIGNALKTYDAPESYFPTLGKSRDSFALDDSGLDQA